MIIVGVDFHPEFQQIASVDTDTGEVQEKRLAIFRHLTKRRVQAELETSLDRFNIAT